MKLKAAIFFLLKHVPGLKSVIRTAISPFFPDMGVSYSYVSLLDEETGPEGSRLRNSWRDNSLPQRQRVLVDQQLRQYRSGASIDVFDVFINSLRALPNLLPGMSLLEIGCSSGFYSEVLEISGLSIEYYGCDYSEAFIDLARRRHPTISFSVMDATALHYPEQSFDIVVSGCCLLHIPEYRKAVEEAARVARHYVIFHRTPIVWGKQEQWYRKQAYGVETVEIHFNETEFLALLSNNSLELLLSYTLHEETTSETLKQGHATRTYVCRKIFQ
jgi:ubiquinone/menaquinone biosynthesis C-methylase UbiE